MSARKQIIEQLAMANGKDGFTFKQLTAAVSALRQRAPNIEIDALRPFDDSVPPERTVFVCMCDRLDAAALVGRSRLPRLPRRVKYRRQGLAFLEVRRVRGARVRILAHISDKSPAGLARWLSPGAIRQLAPEGPETAREWSEYLRKKLRDTIEHCDPKWIEAVLRRPLFPRPIPTSREALHAAFAAVNGRFRLRENDVQHLVALYGRLHEELVRATLEALERSRVEEINPREQASPLRLAVDNTRSDVRP